MFCSCRELIIFYELKFNYSIGYMCVSLIYYYASKVKYVRNILPFNLQLWPITLQTSATILSPYFMSFWLEKAPCAYNIQERLRENNFKEFYHLALEIYEWMTACQSNRLFIYKHWCTYKAPNSMPGNWETNRNK